MNELFLEPKPEFDASNNKKYKVEAIKNSIFYIKKTEKYLLGLSYLIFQKNYLKNKST